MALSLLGWQKLPCDCGNAHFQQAYTLAWHEQHGTSTTPDGWVCTGCGKRSDFAKMINRIKLQNAEQKLDEQREQLKAYL